MLNEALRAVAAEDEQLGASLAVEARLLAEVAAAGRARRQASLKMYAAAAVLIVAVGASVWTVGRPSPKLANASEGGTGREQTTEFFPLHYSSVPAVDAHIVRLEVSRTALASFGLEDSPVNDTSATVLADVIVGSDGLARAVRFVNVGAP